MDDISSIEILISNINDISVEDKIKVISRIVSSTDIPNDFIVRKRGHTEKVFYEIINNEIQRREWLLFVNNTFYCVYCLCFSPNRKQQFVEGFACEKDGLVKRIKAHSIGVYHHTAKNKYSQLVAINVENTAQTYEQSEEFKAAKCIVKIIIFLATHGSYFVTHTFADET